MVIKQMPHLMQTHLSLHRMASVAIWLLLEQQLLVAQPAGNPPGKQASRNARLAQIDLHGQ